MNLSDSLMMSPAEMEFCLYDWLNVEMLTKYERYAEHSRETFDGVIDLSRQFGERYFQPHNRESDLREPRLVDGRVELVPDVAAALAAFADAGLLATTMDHADGGFQLPQIVHRAAFMWLQAANVATASYPMLTAAAAHLLRAHGSEQLVATYLPPMLDGRWFGTMNLSEPGVGSSLADVRTRAVLYPDGSYRVFGEKMWISGGDHEIAENIIHLVLARTGRPADGVKGLSLFLVPKWLGQPGSLEARNDVSLVALNHKMGYRGTVNAALSYGSGDHVVAGELGAVGYLIGEEGAGLAYMFLMMNEARLGVGSSAAALGMTSYLHARDYARNRVQGREIGAKDPRLPPVPIIRHPDVRRLLLASKAYSEGAVALVLYAALLLDESEVAGTPEERRRAVELLDLLTPIAKSWPSQWCLAANDHAIQVHGGSGYARDFPVEQFYRDNRLNPIHEGTHGIQALDLLGRKVRANGGSGLTQLVERMSETVRDAFGDRPDLAAALEKRVDRMVAVTCSLWAAGDPRRALANASLYLEALGHVVVGWLFLDQLVALGDRRDDFARAKSVTAEYFFTHELPRVDCQLDLLESGDDLLMRLDDSLI